MKKETFVSLIKAIEKYMHAAEQFGKDISNAYIKAGAERDFVLSTSYELPYGNFVDSIVETTLLMKTIRLNGRLTLSTGGFMKPILVKRKFITLLTAIVFQNRMQK